MIPPSFSRSRFRLLLTGLAVLLAVPFLRSQEDAPARVRVRGFLLVGDEPRTFHFWDGEALKAQRVSSIQPSREVVLPYRSPLPVFGEGDLTPEGELPAPLARVDLPEGVDRVLLLITQTEEGTRFFAMEDTLHSADERDWMFFNLGNRPVAFVIGEGSEPVLIPARSRFAHRVNDLAGQGTPVKAAARFEGEVRTFYSTFWPMPEGRRNLVLLVPRGDKDDEGIVVRRIVERLPPE